MKYKNELHEIFYTNVIFGLHQRFALNESTSSQKRIWNTHLEKASNPILTDYFSFSQVTSH
jgi:hypothetical protein